MIPSAICRSDFVRDRYRRLQPFQEVFPEKDFDGQGRHPDFIRKGSFRRRMSRAAPSKDFWSSPLHERRALE